MGWAAGALAGMGGASDAVSVPQAAALQMMAAVAAMAAAMRRHRVVVFMAVPLGGRARGGGWHVTAAGCDV
jgi:hypothetical protein